MNNGLRIYQYLGPILLTPLSLALWWQEYELQLQAVAIWVVPILWAYIVPGIGTNVCKVWEFDVAWKLGRFRPHHGFVFGSATSMLAWFAHTHHAVSLGDLFRYSFILASVIGFWNLLYEIKALRIGLLKVYNQPWANNEGPAAIAMDYSPWFFGGFGFAYGALIGAIELFVAAGNRFGTKEFIGFSGTGLIVCIAFPVLGFIRHSLKAHGHAGTRPVPKENK